MNSQQYNALVSSAARTQRLQGYRRVNFGPGEHHWRTTAQRVSGSDRLWRIDVAPGAINDRIACVTYLRSGDPRGWIMPENYAPAARMQAIYGDGFSFVDRSLLETQDAPHLLVTAPVEGDQGDFVRVPDTSRPEVFRTVAQWDRELWQASVFVTATPLRVSRAEINIGFPLPTKNRRWRVYAGQLPAKAATVGAGGHKELARLYLSRVSGLSALDAVDVQQRCFWSMQNLNAEPSFGVLITGLIESVPQGLGDLFLFGVGANLESAATSEFWSV